MVGHAVKTSIRTTQYYNRGHDKRKKTSWATVQFVYRTNQERCGAGNYRELKQMTSDCSEWRIRAGLGSFKNIRDEV